MKESIAQERFTETKQPILQSFQSRVLVAFPQEPVPALDTLFLPDTWTGGCNGDYVRTCFAGRQWTELDLSLLGECAGALLWLSDDGFLYYIAPFLYHFQFLDECYLYAWEAELSPKPFGYHSEEQIARRTGRLTDEQRGIIADYFVYREWQVIEKLKDPDYVPDQQPEHVSWVTTYWQPYATNQALS